MVNNLIHEVAECKLYKSEWLVAAIDYKGDGECFMVRFSGGLAEERARDYAAWQNRKIMSHAPN